jgi:hypothetical protein
MYTWQSIAVLLALGRRPTLQTVVEPFDFLEIARSPSFSGVKSWPTRQMIVDFLAFRKCFAIDPRVMMNGSTVGALLKRRLRIPTGSRQWFQVEMSVR